MTALQCTNIPAAAVADPICTDLPAAAGLGLDCVRRTAAMHRGLSQGLNPCGGPPNIEAFGAARTRPLDSCTHPFGCNTRFGGCTAAGEPCRTLPVGGDCRTQIGPRCPTIPNGDCTFFGNCGPQFGAVGAIVNTRPPQCLQQPTIPGEPCGTFFGPRCPTQPNGDCTFFGDCNPSAIDACPTRIIARRRPRSARRADRNARPQFASVSDPQSLLHAVGTALPEHERPARLHVRLHAVRPNCPQTPMPVCNQTIMERAAGGAAAFGAPQAAAGGDFQITLLTIPVWQCVAPTPATRCFICPPQRSPLPWLCPPPSPWFCTPPISIGIACTIVQCGPGVVVVAVPRRSTAVRPVSVLRRWRS